MQKYHGLFEGRRAEAYACDRWHRSPWRRIKLIASRLQGTPMNKRIRKKRLRQLLLAELATRFGSPEEPITWLESAATARDGRSPREAIGAGEVERVTLVLDGMNRSAAGA